MATAHLHINGMDYELARRWDGEDDQAWQSFRESAERFFHGGSGVAVMDFEVKIKGATQTLTVLLGAVATVAMWLQAPPARSSAGRIY